MRGDKTLYGRVIEHLVPNNRKDDSNEKEDKTCYENAAGVVLFRLFELARTIIGVQLVLRSAHGDEEKHHIPENEADTDEGAFAANVHHARKEGHQNTGNEEGIGQDLDIYRSAVCKEALGPDHKKSDQHLNANTNSVIS